MTPSEKWERLKNPTRLADYGLHMTLTEVSEVPDAVSEIMSYGIPFDEADAAILYRKGVPIEG